MMVDGQINNPFNMFDGKMRLAGPLPATPTGRKRVGVETTWSHNGIHVTQTVETVPSKPSSKPAAGQKRLLDTCRMTYVLENKTAQTHKASPLAALFERMTSSYLRGTEKPGEMTPVDLARNEAARRMEATGAELRRGMNVLASVGSVAPFVGLLGTVVGIIGAFQAIGVSGSAGLGSVMAGISEALIETAFGLMVAIPAVLFFNYLSARVAGIELALGRSMGELLDEMENNHGRKQADDSQEQAA